VAAIGYLCGGSPQGFLSNITNPQVLVFCLAVLPQFLLTRSLLGWVLACARNHALPWPRSLLAVSAGISRLCLWLQRQRMRRAASAGTGVALLGSSALLASERLREGRERGDYAALSSPGSRPDMRDRQRPGTLPGRPPDAEGRRIPGP
jgi:hypothetical protein